MSSLSINKISNQIINIYNVELKQVLTNISENYNIDKNELFDRYINNNICNKKIKSTYINLCMARKQDGNQCTRRKNNISDFCGKHMKNNKYGRIDSHSNIVDKLANDDNYIMTWVEKFNEKDYLIDSNNIVYTMDVDNPSILGKKINGNIKLI